MNEIIKKLIDDHDKILCFIDELENDLLVFMKENIIGFTKMREQIAFTRKFTDKEHHQREEKILFQYMLNNLGSIAENLVKHGMMVEHDLARYYVKEWEEHFNRYEQTREDIDKLAILSYAHSYCNLLRRHIEKENKVVYPFAEKNLTQKLFEEMLENDKNFN